MTGGGEILLREEPPRGDPLGLAMISLAMVPLINQLQAIAKSTMQVWFADDTSGARVLKGLRQWWNAITSIGPSFGYHPNAAKTCLVIREEQ